MAKPQRVKKDGQIYYRVQIRRPTKGILVDEYYKTKREADAQIRAIDTAMAEGRPIANNVQGAVTFEEGVDFYLDGTESKTDRKGRTLKPSAARDRQHRLLWLSKHCFGGMRLKKLTWDVVDAKLSHQMAERDWSPATRYRYESTLSRFLDHCRKQSWVASNVMAYADRLNDSSARRRVYTPKEWRSLLEAADARGDMLAMFLRLAWATGCRKGELVNLRWVDVEPVDHAALGAKLSILDPKNREDRAAFIGKDVYALLQAHQQQFERPSSALVFPSRTRKGRYGVDEPFRAAREAAGLGDPDPKYGEVLTVHHIRHTWATRLADSGANLAQLMAAGGWKTATMAQRYFKTKEEQSAQAAVLLAQ